MTVCHTCSQTGVSYELKRSKRKTVSIKIGASGQVIVFAPNRLAIKEIEGILDQKSHWIHEKKEKMISRQNLYHKRSFEENELFFFLGEAYPLKWEADLQERSKIIFADRTFYYRGERKKPNIQQALIRFYKSEGTKVIKSKVEKHRSFFQNHPNQVKAKEQKSIWGSCTGTNNLYFNWRLLMAPQWVLEYVILHEMTHLDHKNHSKHFWTKLESVCPDYREAKGWLAENGFLLDLENQAVKKII
ncbi:MAG TPA: hypothetical protein DHN33_02505 [Eubacteriaceae bacterium]|nr:hypothetical protein [Eubacteriaceae bacterium]